MSEDSKCVDKPKRRWCQFRLRSLFVFLTLAAIVCSWFACKMAEANRQKKAVQTIQDVGGWVRYDYEFDAGGVYFEDARPPGPAWLRNLLGLDFFSYVNEVYLSYPQVTDDDLEHLKELSEVKQLSLHGAAVTDAGLEHLREMFELRRLYLVDTQVSDAGLEYLHELTRLENLCLINTNVSPAGVRRLSQALPNCEIIY